MSGDDLPPAPESSSALPDRTSAFFNALLTEQFVLQSVRGVKREGPRAPLDARILDAMTELVGKDHE